MTDTPTCKRCRGRGYVRSFYAGRSERRCRCNPAPKKERGPRAATHNGECGVCERRFAVGRNDGRLALHGFSRPGHGFLIGQCPGESRLPVETSPETLELLRDLAKHRAELSESTVTYYRSESLVELSYEIPRPGFNPRTASYAERYEKVTIQRGARADYQRGIPSFADRLAHLIYEADRDAQHARKLEIRATARIEKWEPRELRAL